MKEYGTGGITDRGLQQTLTAVRAVSAQKSWKPQMSYRQFLCQQISFVDAKVWIFQAIVLIAVGIPLGAGLGSRYGEISYRQITFILGIAVIAAAMMGIPYICRSLRHGMYELERVTRFSYSGILSARLMIIGAGNLAMLLGIFAALALSDMTVSLSIAVYMLLPFSAVWSGCIAIMRRLCSQYTHLYCFGFSLSMVALLFLLYKAAPRVFSQEMALFWGLVCIVMIAGLAIEARKLIKKTSSMDAITFNGV